MCPQEFSITTALVTAALPVKMAECDPGVGPSNPKKPRLCSFRVEWKSHGMSASRKGVSYAHCNACNTDFSVAHAGVNDVKKHLATAKHKESSKALSGHQNLSVLFQKDADDQVTRAEVLFANFVAEHNLSFTTADHFTHLTSAMFPDSKIAQEYKCAKTKTTCIIKGALHPVFSEPVVRLCQTFPFSVLCDESNKGDKKHFAVLGHQPVTRFLDVPVANYLSALTQHLKVKKFHGPMLLALNLTLAMS